MSTFIVEFVAIVGSTGTPSMEHIMECLEKDFIAKGLFLDCVNETFHCLGIFVLGRENTDWRDDIIGIRRVDEGGVDKCSGTDNSSRLDSHLSSPAEAIETYNQTVPTTPSKGRNADCGCGGWSFGWVPNFLDPSSLR